MLPPPPPAPPRRGSALPPGGPGGGPPLGEAPPACDRGSGQPVGVTASGPPAWKRGEFPPPPPSAPSSLGATMRGCGASGSRSIPMGEPQGVRRHVSGPPRSQAPQSPRDRAAPCSLETTKLLKNTSSQGFSRPPTRQQPLTQQDLRLATQPWSLPGGGPPIESTTPQVSCMDKFDVDQGLMGILRGFDLGTWASCLANPNLSAAGTQEQISSGLAQFGPEGAAPRPQAPVPCPGPGSAQSARLSWHGGPRRAGPPP